MPEDPGVHHNSGRQCTPYFVQRGFRRLSCGERIRPGLLIDDKSDTRLPERRGIADFVFCPELHPGNVPDADRHAVLDLYNGILEVRKRVDTSVALNDHGLLRRVEKPGLRILIGTPRRVHDFVERDRVIPQLRWIGYDLVLLHLSAEDCHVGNARYRQQTRADGPVRNCPQIRRRDCLRRQTDLQDDSNGRADWHHLRSPGRARQTRARQL